jgi:alpha-L-rhamnosidase
MSKKSSNNTPPNIICFEQYETDKRIKKYIPPEKIIWKTLTIENAEVLLKNRSSQVSLKSLDPCILRNNGEKAGILLDFGVEINGGVQISAYQSGEGEINSKIRIRFGESAMEAMSEFGNKSSSNDHSVRDLTAEIPFLSTTEIGNTGFRFVRIDLLDENGYLELNTIKAIFSYKDIEYKGSFHCSDTLLDKIWLTGAYTVHLNMQGYIWDGIKRDRLVWVGDMHPEISTIEAVFGYDDSVSRSLDFIRDDTPLPGWMNSIPTYSMWWIIIHYSWYLYNGDLSYLKKQKKYLEGLVMQLSASIGEDGKDTTPESRFIDWPSSENKTATDAGIQALHIWAADSAKHLFTALGNNELSAKCAQDIERLSKFAACHDDCKQNAALMVLSGLAEPEQTNNSVLSIGGAANVPSFTGYYILKARAMAGDINGCLDTIRDYWGGMIRLGATTFWEDFDIAWLENAAPIDEIVADGKKDVHGDYGSYCYKGYRKSLCHGWASGPTPWLSEYVLGITVVEPGCRVVRISPNLGDLDWAEGTFPTPFGLIKLRHEKQADGSIKSDIKAPSQITILKD